MVAEHVREGECAVRADGVLLQAYGRERAVGPKRVGESARARSAEPVFSLILS